MPFGDFSDMTAELVGTVPRLSALHAQQILNRSWSRVRDSRLWSFHFVADAQLFVPYGISKGSVSPTFNSREVVVDDVAAGTRRIYRLNPAALAALRDQLDTYWQRALTAYAKAADVPAKEE